MADIDQTVDVCGRFMSILLMAIVKQVENQ